MSIIKLKYNAPLLLVCLACVASVSGCTRTMLPLTQISVPVPDVSVDLAPIMQLFGSYREGNFSNRTWTEAFDAMHGKLSREYPFTDWKAIDWEALYDDFQPRIVAAEAEEDEQAYYLALREYVFSIPDGYMRITTPAEYKEAAIGGDFGFSLLPLEDGTIVVGALDADSFAEHAGIRWGAEIIEWDGKPARDALDAVSVLWSDTPPATHEYALFERCMMMTRAPVGMEINVMFKNPGQESKWVTRLRARRDLFAGLEDLTRQGKPFSEFESPLETRILSENIGYIKIYCQAPTLVAPFPTRAFRRTLDRFKHAEVDGLVLDLRGNSGGAEELAAAYAGHFTRETLFLRDIIAFDIEKGGFALREADRLTVAPRTPFFEKPVAILIHRNTRDSGQAIVHALAPLPNTFTVGALATEGSYAYLGAEITMPLGHRINYPIGRMLDTEGDIVITSGATKENRITPDVRVPFTRENLDLFFNQGGDPALVQAIAEIQRRAAVEQE